MTTSTASFDVHLGDDAYRRALRADVIEGMGSTPKELAPKWFYDATGSDLFDEITRLPEYYPTRREREILLREAATVVGLSGADTVVELGSGTSEKTRIILDAFRDAGRLDRFVPFDVSEQTLRDAAVAINAEYPNVAVHGVVGDFDHHLSLLPRQGRRMVAFLGGTIGNFTPKARREFYADLARGLDAGDTLLLGTDLVKDPGRLVAAYDDAAGITAAFNRNVLTVINRELDGDIDVDAFTHVARWNDDEHRIEMWLRCQRAHVATLDDAELEVSFADGEEMLTEISTKFTRAVVTEDLAEAGFGERAWWTDQAGDYALSLWTRC